MFFFSFPSFNLVNFFCKSCCIFPPHKTDPPPCGWLALINCDQLSAPAVAAALGRLVKYGGILTADVVDREARKALDWYGGWEGGEGTMRSSVNRYTRPSTGARGGGGGFAKERLLRPLQMPKRR